MSIKTNDWFAVVTNIDSNESINLGENPYATLQANGITPDNTGLREKDYYKNIPQIQRQFTKSDGTFDNVRFDQKYDSAQRSFTEFAELDFTEKLLNAIGTTPYDSGILDNPEKRVNHFEAVLTPFHDKNRSTYGTGNLWETGSPTFSDREVAQANFVRDENGNVLDWTPNDKSGIFRGLFAPALAYASYDEDVYDDTGRLIHQKGELKLDENGDPYTELLGTREAYGKQMVKWTDTLSVEGTFWNKIDIFDSDSLDKSVIKTVAQTAAMLFPYFTPIAPYWGWVNASMAMAKAVPNVVKSLNGLITNNNDNIVGESMTWLENVMGRFGSTRSDAAQGKFFSAENIGDIIVSSAGQLFSQRQIANLAGKWSPFKSAEANKKFAQNLSLGYMSITSASESYGAFKEAGAEDWLAGLGSVLTMGAYYTLLNQGYFKDKLFENTWLDEDIRTVKNISALTQHAVNKIFPNLANVTKEEAKKKLPEIWKNIVKAIPRGLAYESHSMLSRSLNEGIEELTEEVAQDLVKGLAKALESIGIDCTNGVEKLDFGWNVAEAAKRYGSSFLGGMIGGAVFEANTQWNLYRDPNYKKMLNSPPVRRMYYDIMRGKADKYREIIREQGSKKLNGNYNLSTIAREVKGTNDEITKVYGTGTETDNQNLAVTNALLQLVDNAETICENYRLVYQDKELLKKILGTSSMKEYMRESGKSESEIMMKGLLGGQSEAEAIVNSLLELTTGEGDNKISIGEIIAENVLTDVNNIRQEILDTELQIEQILSRFPSEEIKTEEDKKRIIKSSSTLKALEEKKKELVKQFDEIVQGKHADHFLTQILMMFNQDLINKYVGLGNDPDKNGALKNLSNFAKFYYHVDNFNELKDESLKQTIQDDYERHFSDNNNVIRKIADLHLALSESSAESLKRIESELKDAQLSDNYLVNSQKITIRDLIDKMDKMDAEQFLTIRRFAEMGMTDPNDDPKLKEAFRIREMIRMHREYFNTLPGEEQLDEWFNPINPSTEIENDHEITVRQNMLREFYKEVVSKKMIGVTDKHIRQFFARWNLGATTRLKSWNNLWKAFYDINRIAKQSGLTVDQINEIRTTGEFSGMDPDFPIDSVQELDESEINSAKKKAEELIQKIQQIENLFKINPQEALSKIQQLFQELSASDENGNPIFNINAVNEEQFFDAVNSVEDFVHRIFDPSKTNDPIAFAEEIFELYNKRKPSPLIEFIQEISTKITGTPSRIFDIIARGKADIKSAGIEKYMLSKSAEKDIYDAEGILNLVSGILEGSLPGNINELINTKRLENPLPIISENTAQILKTELEFVKRQFEALKRISKLNEGNRITENKNVIKYDSVKRYMAFLDAETPLVKELQKAIGIDFYELASSLNLKTDYSTDNLESMTDDQFDLFYQDEVRFKEALFNWIKEKPISEQVEIFEKIGQVAATYAESNSDEFSNESDSKVGDWGNIRYLLSNLATDFKEFQRYYRAATEKEKGFLPFGPQEFVIRDAYSSYERVDLYNAFLKGMHEKTLENGPKNNNYLQHMKRVENFLFINGIPGSGKSSAVAKILIDTLRLKHPELKVIALVQDSSRLNSTEDSPSFDKVVGADEAYVTSKFIEDNVYPGIQEDVKSKETKGHSGIDASLPELKSTDKFKNVLFVVDEATFTNEAQWLAFSKFVEKINSKDGAHSSIIGLGDFYQCGADSSHTDVTDTFFQSTIRLTSGFRTTNNGKAQNERMARGVLKTAIDAYHKNIAIGAAEINQITFDSIALLSTEPLIGHVDSEGRVFGDVKVSGSNVDSMITSLKNLEEKPKICIITDDPSKWEKYSDEQIDIRTPLAAQGGQWDYVISDCNFAFTKDDSLIPFRKFYTIMTRAKNGTIWTGNIGDIQFKDIEDAVNVVGADMNSEKIVSEYVNWRSHLFDLINVEAVSINTSDTITSDDSVSEPIIPPATFDSSSDTTDESTFDVYSPVTPDEITHFRDTLYAEDSDDPEIRQFQKLHQEHIKNYRERQKSLKTGGLDFDSWYAWIQNDENLAKAFTLSGLNNPNSEAFTRFLLFTSEIVAKCLSANEDVKKITQALVNEYVDKPSEFSNLARVIVSKLNDNLSGQLQLQKIGTKDGQNINIVYYVFTDESGNNIALPLFANRSEKTNCAYHLKDASTSLVCKPIPISSNGVKFTTIEEVSKKVGIMDRIVIFKGVDETKVELTESQKRFNKNKGKAFILVESITDPTAYETWNTFFNVKYEENGEITSFVTEDGKRYVSLVGVQSKLSTDQFLDIIEDIQFAMVAAKDGDWDTYDKKLESLRNRLGDGFGIKTMGYNKEHSHYDPETIFNETNMFSPMVASYILNFMFRHYSETLPGINTHLSKDKRNIGLNFLGTTVNIYSDFGIDGTPKYRICFGNNPSETNIEIAIPDTVLHNNDAKPVDYLLDLFAHAIYDAASKGVSEENKTEYNEFVEFFGLKDSLSDVNKIRAVLQEALNKENKNGSYGCNFELGTAHIRNGNDVWSFSIWGFANWLHSWHKSSNKSDNVKIRSFIREHSHLFKHDLINVNVFATSWKEDDKQVVWGFTDGLGQKNLGWDIVDILPTTYSMNIDGEAIENPDLVFSEIISTEGTISVDNKFVNLNNDLIDLRPNKVKVDREWIISHVADEKLVPSGDKFIVDSIEKSTGKIELKGIPSGSIILTKSGIDSLLSQLKDDEIKLHWGLTIRGTDISFNGNKVDKIIGFTRDDETIVHFICDGKIEFGEVNPDVMRRLQSNAVIQEDDIVTLKQDSSTGVSEMITVGQNGYKKYKVSNNEFIQVSDYIVSTKDVSESEMNKWDKRHNLSSSYSAFAKVVNDDLSSSWNSRNIDVENKCKEDIRVILETSSSIDEAINSINELLDKKKYSIGMKIKYTQQGTHTVDLQNRNQYIFGYLVNELYENDVVKEVEIFGESPEFLVTLSDDSQHTFIYDMDSDTVSPKVSNKKLSEYLEKMWNDETIKSLLIGEGITTLEDFTTIWNSDPDYSITLYAMCDAIDYEDGTKLISEANKLNTNCY